MNLKNKKILITCGPTWVPVDDMRVISNRSTGSLGQKAAVKFTKENAKVTLLEGPVSNPLNNKNVRVLKFLFYDELVGLLNSELKKEYDIVIHAAAVSDYRLKKPFKKKLSSDVKSLTLELVPTQKIIKKIKKIDPKVFLVGFKLESKITKGSAPKEAAGLFKGSSCDLVIANSLTKKNYSGFILGKNGQFLSNANSREGIVKELIKILNHI